MKNDQLIKMLETSFSDLHLSVKEKSEINEALSAFSNEAERLAFVRNQAIKIVARNFGTTRNPTGSSPIVLSASISSLIFIVPNSAA